MLDLNIVKAHLNLEKNFHDDDAYIMTLMDTAWNATIRYMDFPNETYAYLQDGSVKPEVQQAALLLIGTWYANRETIAYGGPIKISHGFDFLCDLLRDYSIKK